MTSRPAAPRSALAVLVGFLILTSCSVGQQSPSAPGPSLPDRPTDVDVLRIEPCTMLDPSQRATLGVRPGKPGQATVNGAPTRGCVWLGADMDLNAQTFPVGAEQALTDPTALPTTVAGFGAVQTWVATPGSMAPPICLITVDTAEAQGLRVQASPGPDERSDPDTERPVVCARAQQLGEAVMSTLLRQPR